ncbi:MAG: DUF4160 domain-containing protein [Spirochaetales bacterium]|nr:DUF4160 domain-containing protein [Spirochaetales bacterium]
MPTIALFWGIRILMYWNDHEPPHFHVEYQEQKAVLGVDPLVVQKGCLPNRVLRLVLAWAELHKEELLQDWELSRDGKPLQLIEGLKS